MKLQTYNYIKQCLEMGHKVEVGTKWGSTFIETVDAMYDEDFCKDNFTDEYEITPRIPKLLQPGEKGFILDTPEIREYVKKGWRDEDKALLGTVCTISAATYSWEGFYYVEESNVGIPFFMVAPVLPEESKLADVDTEEMVKELEDRGVLVNGKVLK